MNIHLDARDIRGGECPGQLELHGGARVAAGVPDPDHRQHCPGYCYHHHYSQYSHCPLAQFAFVLFTMAKEERVKESGGRGLPLSLQSLQGGSTVDTGKNICGYKKYLQMIHLETERRFSQDDPRNIY